MVIAGPTVWVIQQKTWSYTVMEQKKKVVIDVQLFQVKTYFPLSLKLGNIMAKSCRVVKGRYYMEMEGLMRAIQLPLTLANGCNPTTSFAQAFQHASSNDIHSHDE